MFMYPRSFACTCTNMTDSAIRCASFLDKGGTGKTTTVAHIGVAAAEQGHDVLCIDLAGKQGDLAKHFGVWDRVLAAVESDDDDADWPNISTAFTEQWRPIVSRAGAEIVEELIIETGEGVDLIPAHPGLDGLDDRLGNIEDRRERYARLDRVLDTDIEPLGYDVILIDLPGLSNNVAYNGVYAAGNVLAPVEMGPFESEQAAQLDADLGAFRDQYTDVDLVMVLPNKVDTRTKLGAAYLDEFAERYPAAIAPEPIPSSQDIRNAAKAGRTVFALDDPSATAKRARDAYLTNTTELLTRLRTQ